MSLKVIDTLNSRKKTDPVVTLHQEKDASNEDIRIELINAGKNAKIGSKARSAFVIMAEHFGIPRKIVDDS